ncbi:MAG: TonB-dependent receptor [Acidobacteriota bacterium]|nr:TonB-dependent receptor [Acidobacteriota bacterium]
MTQGRALIAITQRRALCFAPFLLCCAAHAQIHTGELRFQVTDPAGLGLRSALEVSSPANRYKAVLTTDNTGRADLPRLPYGVYLITAQHAGFTSIARTLSIHTALPADCVLTLQVEPVTTVVDVNQRATLIDPDRSTSIQQLGAKEIEDRTSSLPGRSLQDLVASQPGWLYEGNAVLHPRGSEYQTQFVIDGLPLTDNRSPGFGPEIEADDVDSISIYTAGIPAEYGRKMGGVVELNTRHNPNPGLHGDLVLSGGSYDTAQAYAHAQNTWSKNTLGATASGSMTAHYLNPVVPANFTNRGTTGDFSTRFERDFRESDRLVLNARHELSRFQIPNEYVQQHAGQLQTGANFETMGTASYQHIFSANSLLNLSGMVRDKSGQLSSNEFSTPILAFQNNDLREGYFKASFTLHRGLQEIKAGIENDATTLHENFRYQITDPTQFDPDTPPSLTFADSRVDLEQSAFLEDVLHLGPWTVSAGLRWDHYQLLLNQNAFSPRFSVGRSLPSLNMVLHASYDRIFQTPSFENILLSSSPAIDALSAQFLRLPVKPSLGNYYEGGLTKAFSDRLRLDANLYRRAVNNFADDDQLLNTGISYPISFNHAVIYGAEGKLDLVRLGKLTGFLSYSYMVGNVWFPVTGGLFLGSNASAALSQSRGHFPNTQDQRNTVQTRFQYQLTPRLWVASGAGYGSGLPFAFDGNQSDALAQYGPAVISRINFDRGRLRPWLALSASLSADLFERDQLKVRLQIDGENLNNRLNVIDFGGLFSGNAIAPQRSIFLRLNTSF